MTRCMSDESIYEYNLLGVEDPNPNVSTNVFFGALK